MGAASHVVDLDRFKTCDQVPVCPIVNTRELRNYIFQQQPSERMGSSAKSWSRSAARPSTSICPTFAVVIGAQDRDFNLVVRERRFLTITDLDYAG